MRGYDQWKTASPYDESRSWVDEAEQFLGRIDKHGYVTDEEGLLFRYGSMRGLENVAHQIIQGLLEEI